MKEKSSMSAYVIRIIDELGLSEHPEGGYFKETYRSDEQITRVSGATQPAATAIDFLLPAEAGIVLHRTKCGTFIRARRLCLR